MRWFLGLVLVVAVVAAGLYGVGRFVLKNTLEVTRTAEIARPRAAVFAMMNDLRIAKEWSPFYARDPDADYAFNGDPGQGQSMRWSSSVREVGVGRMSIVRSTDLEEVESILEIGDRATLTSRQSLRPIEGGGTAVSWTITAECAEGSVNVPCRYMNLIMRGRIQAELDAGLTRLKTLAEQLPDVDFEGLNPEIILDVEPQTYAYCVASTSASDQAEFERNQALCIESVQSFMAAYSLTRSGPLVRATTVYDAAEGRIEFRVGYPFEGPRPISFAGAQVGETPSGPALHVWHVGPRSQVRMTYARIEAYLQAHRIARREDGLPWEIVHYEGAADDPNPTRIEIYMPLQ